MVWESDSDSGASKKGSRALSRPWFLTPVRWMQTVAASPALPKQKAPSTAQTLT